MLKFILVFSRLGKIRLKRHWQTISIQEKVKIAHDVLPLVLSRSKVLSSIIDYKGQRLVYKRYASLFFCVCLDNKENELLVLEAIHRFVQGLDAAFGNVSELDILFGMQKAYAVMDEIWVGGEIQESSLRRVNHYMNEVKTR
jgi:AP-1 complex subunit sigma 1/2